MLKHPNHHQLNLEQFFLLFLFYFHFILFFSNSDSSQCFPAVLWTETELCNFVDCIFFPCHCLLKVLHNPSLLRPHHACIMTETDLNNTTFSYGTLLQKMWNSFLKYVVKMSVINYTHLMFLLFWWIFITLVYNSKGCKYKRKKHHIFFKIGDTGLIRNCSGWWWCKHS